MKAVIITNNLEVREKYNNQYTLKFIKGTYMDVLLLTRDKIHEGHKLLTHPLSGSIKPNETPYKSIIVSFEKGNLDTDSLIIIEDSISTAKKFIQMKTYPNWTEEVLQDFMEIDCSLLDGAIESMSQFK